MAEGKEESKSSEESVKLFVGQVPKHMTEPELLAMFQEFALVDEVNIIKDKATRVSRGTFPTLYSPTLFFLLFLSPAPLVSPPSNPNFAFPSQVVVSSYVLPGRRLIRPSMRVTTRRRYPGLVLAANCFSLFFFFLYIFFLIDKLNLFLHMVVLNVMDAFGFVM